MIAFAAATIEESSDGEETALFALLMADLAEAEGAAAWEENERLKRDPEAVAPLEVQRHCLKPISRSCTDKTFRADPLNLLIETFADRTERSFFGGNSNRGSGEGALRATPQWLPEGYALRDARSDSRGTRYTYAGTTEEETIFVAVFAGEGMSLGLDTEDADTRTVEMQGHSGLQITKDGIMQLTWADEERGYCMLVEGSQGLGDGLMEFAEQLEIRGFCLMQGPWGLTVCAKERGVSENKGAPLTEASGWGLRSWGERYREQALISLEISACLAAEAELAPAAPGHAPPPTVLTAAFGAFGPGCSAGGCVLCLPLPPARFLFGVRRWAGVLPAGRAVRW